MALQRTLVNPDSSFTPLFRLLDDFDAYTRGGDAGQVGHRRGHLSGFQPNFDVRELADAYELQGELPGINKENVHIEFTDPQTLLVRGHVERSYTSGDPPPDLLEKQKTSGAVTQSGERQHDKQAKGDAAKADETTKTGEAQHKEQKPADKAKYWVSERSVGDFSRTFSFPHAVQQDGVTASLKDGILNLHVPKAKKPEARRITVN